MSSSSHRILICALFFVSAAFELIGDPSDWASALVWAAIGVMFFITLRQGKRMARD